MSLKIAYKNPKEPLNAPVKPLSEILKEKWTKRDREAAERKYGKRKAK